MRPQHRTPFDSRQRENEFAAKTFDTYEGGETVTCVRVFARPVKLWVNSARDGALVMVTITPRRDGGYDLELAADRSKVLDLQGLPFDNVQFGVTRVTDGGSLPL